MIDAAHIVIGAILTYFMERGIKFIFYFFFNVIFKYKLLVNIFETYSFGIQMELIWSKCARHNIEQCTGNSQHIRERRFYCFSSS